MSELKNALNGNQNSTSPPAPNASGNSSSQTPSQKKTAAPQNSATNPTSTNKSNVSANQSSIHESNNNRASQPDWVSKMKQDMEDSKSPKQKEWEEGRKQYKDLLSQANSAYECSGMYMMPVTIVALKDGVVFLDMRNKIVTNLYSEIKIQDNLIYFSQADARIQNAKFKYVLDTSNNKLVQLVEAAGTKNANENTCKKIK